MHLNWEELKQLPFGFIKDDWPASLKSFITDCYRLSEIRFSGQNVSSFIKGECKVHQYIEKKTPKKKQEEIKTLSFLINEICDNTKCNTVIDVGSGLGYLSETLHYNYGLQCIGLDSLPHHVKEAKVRRKNDLCISSLHYETMTVKNTDDCVRKIRDVLNEAGSKQCGYISKNHDIVKSAEFVKLNSIAMIGLHCCGNLTQDMMKLFCHMSELKAFVCVGCCYNKISLDEFPMSQATKNAVCEIKNVYPNWSPCTSGLRLGSERTRSDLSIFTPESLFYKQKCLMFRAVLECYIQQENINWHRPKRRIKLQNNADFREYCTAAFAGSEQGENELQLKKLTEMYLERECLYPQIRILLMLQLILQPLWEVFVTIDRLLYFQENSIRAEVFTLWNDLDSPRNLALCGYKI
ncbi:probable methyltransferase-like protein 25 isoform X3 [Uloborus diversus]|nr:probable methyltransferase-like protein 25 isoform X3 [Uloborus diversus]